MESSEDILDEHEYDRFCAEQDVIVVGRAVRLKGGSERLTVEWVDGDAAGVAWMFCGAIHRAQVLTGALAVELTDEQAEERRGKRLEIAQRILARRDATKPPVPEPVRKPRSAWPFLRMAGRE